MSQRYMPGAGSIMRCAPRMLLGGRLSPDVWEIRLRGVDFVEIAPVSAALSMFTEQALDLVVGGDCHRGWERLR